MGHTSLVHANFEKELANLIAAGIGVGVSYIHVPLRQMADFIDEFEGSKADLREHYRQMAAERYTDEDAAPVAERTAEDAAAVAERKRLVLAAIACADDAARECLRTGGTAAEAESEWKCWFEEELATQIPA